MADHYKTRCPHCSAQFKITDAHLKQAKGAVRCGSCLQIFQANEHLLDAPPETNNKASGDDDERWAFSLDEASQIEEQDPLDSWSLDDAPRPEKAAPAKQADKEPDQDLQLSDSFLNLEEGDDSFSLDENFSDMHGAGKASHSDDSDESWAEALLAELDDDNPAKPASNTQTPPPVTSAAFLKQPSPAQPSNTQTSAPATPAKRSDTAQTVAEAKQDNDDDEHLFAGLDLFADEPEKTIATQVTRSTPGHHTAHPIPPRDYRPLLQWSGLSLLALVVLAGQYLFFNFDDLARTQQWRPYYAQACQWIGCELPNRSDVSKLRGANLVVRSHPQYQNALVVDAILFNEAHYQQPFPILELSFSSLNGQPVASRQFQPYEYLQGELANMTSMPIGTPLHLSLEIVDPGEQAVNYNLRLLPVPEHNYDG